MVKAIIKIKLKLIRLLNKKGELFSSPFSHTYGIYAITLSKQVKPLALYSPLLAFFYSQEQSSS